MARRFMPLEPFSESALRRRLAASKPDLADEEKQEHRWIVVHGDEPVGVVALLRPSFRLGNAEVSYHIGEAFHRKGIATRALSALVQMVFEQTRLERLFAFISEGNRGSRRLAEKLGFVHEGTLREHFPIQGKRVDQCLYGLLRRDWAKMHKQGHRARF